MMSSIFAGLAQSAGLGLFAGHTDIGNVAKAGSAEFDTKAGVYRVTGGGENMWFTNDACHFVWKRVEGDVALAADIRWPIAGGNAHRKACLILRQSLAADAAYADAVLHGDGLTSLQYRESSGAPTREIQSNVSGPARLQIEKRGDYVSMSIAPAGEPLRPAGGSFRIELKSPFYVGLAVCAHDNQVLETAEFSNVSITTPPLLDPAKARVASTLEIVNLASMDRRVVYHTRDLIEAPNWMPDGQHLLFNGGGRLYKLPVKGGQPQLLDTGFANRCNNDHGISPDGKRLAISDQTEDGKSRIYTLPIAGGKATPLTRGLIHRAILESGGCIASAAVDKGYEQGRKTAAKLGCAADDLACLRAVPADKLLKSSTDSQLSGFVWMPHHDGHVLLDSPLNMIRAGNYNQIPFMAGSNRNEVDALVGIVPELGRAKPEQFESLTQKYLGLSAEEAKRLAELYPPTNFKNTTAAFGAAATDGALGCPTYLGLLAASAGPAPTYYYRFDYHGMYMGEVLGAVHAMEIPFVFNTLDRKPISLLYPGKVKPETAELARVVQGYWLNFARAGNPNGPGLPDWPAFTPEARVMQVLDAPVRPEPVANEDQCRFWDEYNQSHPPLFETMGGIGGD